MADKIKEAKDISSLIETLLPEFITADHAKMKIFVEKYYEFMESHQVYFVLKIYQILWKSILLGEFF